MTKEEKQVYIKTKELFEGCALCGNPNVAMHHVYEGKNRKNSTKYSMIVPLCHFHHEWVHKTNYKGFKIEYQKKFEEKYTREEFIKIFGRSYL